uniref:HTH psq-type domain-containing protein n=1 Tax=Kryptolebias marmoratus TaxID=37003 RepID=A0A3Q3B6A0_KRYMA
LPPSVVHLLTEAHLSKLDNRQSCRAFAQEYGCGKTQIARIRSEREEIMKEWESGTRSDLKYVKKRKTVYEDLNTALWDWFCTARSKDLPVSGRLLQVSRPSFFFFVSVLSGESVEIPAEVVEDWSKQLPELIKDHALSDIYNADETGLYYRALPKCSMVVKGDPRKGLKTAKERLTVLLACSVTGDKLNEPEEEPEPKPTPVISSGEVLAQVRNLMDFALCANDRDLIEELAKVQNMVEDHCLKKASVATQKTIVDFFRQR